MAKEIKFRGKCLDTNEWIYGFLVRMGEQSAIVTTDPERGLTLWMIDSKTSEQFAGRRDDNGTEVYEAV